MAILRIAKALSRRANTQRRGLRGQTPHNPAEETPCPILVKLMEEGPVPETSQGKSNSSKRAEEPKAEAIREARAAFDATMDAGSKQAEDLSELLKATTNVRHDVHKSVEALVLTLSRLRLNRETLTRIADPICILEDKETQTDSTGPVERTAMRRDVRSNDILPNYAAFK